MHVPWNDCGGAIFWGILPGLAYPKLIPRSCAHSKRYGPIPRPPHAATAPRETAHRPWRLGDLETYPCRPRDTASHDMQQNVRGTVSEQSRARPHPQSPSPTLATLTHTHTCTHRTTYGLLSTPTILIHFGPCLPPHSQGA